MRFHPRGNLWLSAKAGNRTQIDDDQEEKKSITGYQHPH